MPGNRPHQMFERIFFSGIGVGAKARSLRGKTRNMKTQIPNRFVRNPCFRVLALVCVSMFECHIEPNLAGS